MRKAFGYIVAIALAAGLTLVFRAHVLTIYVMPDNSLAPNMGKGEWVVLNRLDKHHLSRGETIVFRDSTLAEHAGRVLNIPGDTLQLADTALFVLPSWHRCPRCGSNRCRNYLVGTSSGQTLIHESSIAGRIHRILSFVR